MTTATATATTKTYFLNVETSKIELEFSKSEYQSLSETEKKSLKSAFLFSGSRSVWVSRSTNNHYSAIYAAKNLGFEDGGKIGERLSFAEQVERQAEKAENRAERFEQYAENAEHKAKAMQLEFDELRKDFSWLTQPVIAGNSRSQRFQAQRERVMNRYDKGFEEYRKSEYFKQKATTAAETASMEKYKDKTYLNNRIEEANKEIRALQRAMVQTEETNNETWQEKLLDAIEFQLDKLAYLHNCLDNVGGITYNKDNVKAGYIVKIRGTWRIVVKANAKTVEAKSPNVPFSLKYAYAEIKEMKIPTDKKEG